MNKRGSELTMSTIIIAVLVILVLIVLVLIFSKTARNFFLGTSGCISQGGQCQSELCSEGYSNMFSGNPECESKYGDGFVCCKTSNSILGQKDEQY
jgi:hypothetical protein